MSNTWIGETMNLRKRAYVESDYLRIRDFLVHTYSQDDLCKNWLLDRWNFCRYVSQSFHKTYDTWPKTVGIWVDKNDEIKAVVNSEGENRGEAFFQLDNMDFSSATLLDFIHHAETYFKVNHAGKFILNLRVCPQNLTLKELLRARNYSLLDYQESFSSMEVKRELEVNLPKNFSIADANKVDDYQKGFAHGRAFGYYKNEKPDDGDAEIAFASMRKAPDYHPSLDFSIIDENGEVAAFANMWYDAVNKIGILEPVGTIPKYQKMGLGKAVIFEAINKVRKMGATKIYVGSDEEFYLKIGFSLEYTYEIWQKRW
jgi:predicted N-acetyltransferase YhbS